VLAQVRAADALDDIKGKVGTVRQLLTINTSSARPIFAEGEQGTLSLSFKALCKV
jgi:hypothetical protein